MPRTICVPRCLQVTFGTATGSATAQLRVKGYSQCVQNVGCPQGLIKQGRYSVPFCPNAFQTELNPTGGLSQVFLTRLSHGGTCQSEDAIPQWAPMVTRVTRPSFCGIGPRFVLAGSWSMAASSTALAQHRLEVLLVGEAGF